MKGSISQSNLDYHRQAQTYPAGMLALLDLRGNIVSLANLQRTAIKTHLQNQSEYSE